MAEGQIKCRNCETMNENDQLYCRNCGVNLHLTAEQLEQVKKGRPAPPPQPAPESAAWECGSCGEEVEGHFDVCWNCQAERGNAPTAAGPSATSAAANGRAHSTRGRNRKLSEQLEKRYKDAYRIARATIFFGGLAKGLGVAFAVLVVGVSLIVSEESSALAITGALSGVFSGFLLYVGGILVAAHGQLLLTSTDAVINTSPFLTDSERAEIMRVAFEATTS